MDSVPLLLLIITFTQFQVAFFTGRVELQIEYIKNEDGLLKNEKCCNGAWKENLKCSGTCNTYLAVCVTNLDAKENCDIGYSETPSLKGNTFLFEVSGQELQPLSSEYRKTSHKVNQTLFANDISFNLPMIVPSKNAFRISVEVRHQSTGKSELIRDLVATESFTPHNKWVAIQSPWIGFHVRVSCDLKNPQFWCDSQGNYFGYGENGKKLCHDGWEGPNCNQNSSICQARLNRHYDCKNNKKICHQGWTGPNCEISTYSQLCIPRDDITGHYGCSYTGEKVCNVGWTGPNCLQDIDDCSQNPCKQNGSCIDRHANFKCVCPSPFGGPTCELDLSKTTCQNGGQMLSDGSCSCIEGWKGSRCEVCVPALICKDHGSCKTPGKCDGDCIDGWVGGFCQEEQNSCSDNRGKKFCTEHGQCVTGHDNSISGQSWKCICKSGWTGHHCEIKIHICDNNSPCENGGTCSRAGEDFNDSQYTCHCIPGFSGQHCETNTDDCAEAKCENGGVCEDEVNGYTCHCPLKYEGQYCQTLKNPCEKGMCSATSTCENLYYDYHCHCFPGYHGKHCNHYNCDWRCKNNGKCSVTLTGDNYECSCAPGYAGRYCEQDIDDCAKNPCAQGVCIDQVNSFRCVCHTGFTGPTCNTTVDYCTQNPCSNNGQCINLATDFMCQCKTGWSGKRCGQPAESTILLSGCSKCQHATACTVRGDSFVCICEEGFSGDFCEINNNDCINHACDHGTCIDRLSSYECVCDRGFDGEFCKHNIDDCASSPCKNGAECVDEINSFHCMCPRGFEGFDCSHNVDDCAEVDCQNAGTCVDLTDDFMCRCREGYEGKFCEIPTLCKTVVCRGNAQCVQEGFDTRCECPPELTGELCDVALNKCVEDTCLNNGVCVYKQNQQKCICETGFYGERCEWFDVCQQLNQCANNATCINVGNDFTCTCKPGYFGKKCQHVQDTCLMFDRNPTSATYNALVPTGVCSEHGRCVALPQNKFRCQCDRGWNGDRCEVDIDNCVNTYCANNGQCVDLEDDFRCECPSGFRGDLCHINIDNCVGDPCENGGVCQDLVNDFYCDCKDGWQGKTCSSRESSCSETTCKNGGECWQKDDKFRCVCANGFKGPTCAEQKKQCSPETCNHHGVCVENGTAFSCQCKAGYQGEFCEIDIDDCLSSPCKNGGKCVDGVNWFHCKCPAGIYGANCEHVYDECYPSPCAHPFECVSLVPGYKCVCPEGKTGPFCTENTEKKRCEENNMIYAHNETWIVDCNTCQCLGGISVCTQAQCGPTNCFDNRYHPGCDCQPKQNVVCMSPPCAPWGECNVRRAPVSDGGFLSLDAPVTTDCVRMHFQYNVDKLQKGVSLEEVCQGFRFLELFHLYATDVRLECWHLNTTVPQVTVGLHAPEVAKQVATEIVAVYTRTAKDNNNNNDDKLMQFFAAVVNRVRIESPKKRIDNKGIVIPVVCSVVLLIMIILLVLCIWGYRKRRIKRRETMACAEVFVKTRNKLKDSPEATPRHAKSLEHFEVTSQSPTTSRRKLAASCENLMAKCEPNENIFTSDERDKLNVKTPLNV